MENVSFKNIRTNIKVSLPWYISIPAIMFSLVFPFVFGCDTYDDVGIILDKGFSFLAVLVFSNIYYIEFQQKTAEVYHLVSNKNRRIDICRRIIIRLFFLIAMVVICFEGYVLQGLHIYAGDVKEVLIAQAYFAIISGIIFFGGISFMLVNLLKNLGAGIGVTILIWLMLSSSIGLKLPASLNVFAYGATSDWIIGKIVAGIMGIFFFFGGTVLINENSCKC